MQWPQIVVIVLMAMGVTVHLVKNGEPSNTKFNFLAKLGATAIWAGLLYAGGFFG